MTDRGEVALLWLALEHHPDEQVRLALREMLRTVSADPHDRQLDLDLLTLLRRERGTVIEPFVLDDGDAERAVELLRLASASSPHGLQVVSRDKLEPEGGLLLSRTAAEPQVQVDYLQRLATRVSRSPDSARAWRFSPGHAPPIDKLVDSVGSAAAIVRVDDKGVHTILGPFLPQSALDRVRPYAAGTIAITDEPLGTIGGSLDVRRTAGEAWLTVTARRPELQIRLTAAMVAQDWIVLDLSAAAMGIAAIAIRLDTPEEGREVALQAVRILGEPVIGRLEAWIRSPETVRAPNVMPAVARAIGDWLGIVPSWLTSELLQEYV